MATGLKLFTNRVGDVAGAPLLDSASGEELIHTQPGVSVVLANRPPETPGTLYISTRRVVWLSDVDRAKGYAVDFLSISLHAVSRDPEAYALPCIYTQIDTGADDKSEDSDSESNEIEALDLSKITEMRLVPSDPNQVDTLFEIFCRCAQLNPGPVEEDAEEHNWISSVDQMEAGLMDGDDAGWPDLLNSTTTIGHSNGDLSHSVLELRINDERFEDAEEMDSENNQNRN